MYKTKFHTYVNVSKPADVVVRRSNGGDHSVPFDLVKFHTSETRTND